MMKQKTLYKLLALTLTVTQYTELLWETVAKQRDSKKYVPVASVGTMNSRWKTIIGIESFKSALRLALIAVSKRQLVTPPIPEREYDPGQGPPPKDPQQPPQSGLLSNNGSPSASGYLGDSSVSSLSSSWIMPRTGTPLPETPIDSKSFLTSKVLQLEDVQHPFDLLTKLNFRPPSKALVAELLYILRPLIYALLAYKYRSRPRNWTPWLAGIALEYYSRRLAMQHYQETLPRGLNSASKLEADELKKRATVLWWWSVRGAMYHTTVRPVLHGVVSRTENVPLVNLFGSILQDYLYLLDNYHFSSSSL
ncbi:hypothetical protein AWJ20_3190 [Sugiyamaella lignohabitans]|uniref:Peroxisomal membrane protein PEX16 n=1 Tax=Sugiyamaella lignohabitans TaxID=796027 RepID=A0A167FQB5_9ASCO|nr:uncharacterized protein AWJ20_3190 [Sugiyamaella lignohabitans]ANB15562.1 hypothetical protein AWJ20_3190 [Sugiyamaella lignohabitans]